MKPPYTDVIERLDILTRLAEFRPVVIGTPPLGALSIATDESDIDIAYTSQDFDRFFAVVGRAFDRMDAFCVRNVYHLSAPAPVASFRAKGWEIELLCQKVATVHQWGVRHFRVEARLLALKTQLRDAVLRLKRDGMKTEPAFAKVLSLPGDPYVALLEFDSIEDSHLQEVIDEAT